MAVAAQSSEDITLQSKIADISPKVINHMKGELIKINSKKLKSVKLSLPFDLIKWKNDFNKNLS